MCARSSEDWSADQLPSRSLLRELLAAPPFFLPALLTYMRVPILVPAFFSSAFDDPAVFFDAADFPLLAPGFACLVPFPAGILFPLLLSRPDVSGKLTRRV